MGVEASLNNLPISKLRIVVVAPKSGESCLTELANLPKEARILGIGPNMEELQKDGTFFTEANVILNVSGNARILAELLNEMPFVTWIHSLTAGVDHLLCPEITNNNDITLTNAKGVFSSSLGEYVMGACSYFSKDFPRLIQQKNDRVWNSFCVRELRGLTMGIVGFGSIGFACARLAKAYGMRVIALRRNTQLYSNEKYVDQVYGTSDLNTVIEQSDFLVVCLALTNETRKFIKAENLKKAKKDMILINIGRGALIDEEALIKALKDGTIAGAALDVFTVEPLPQTSQIWDLPNVLLSPHNADLLIDSKHKSVRLFNDNCAKFLADEELECIVDKNAGY